LLHRVGIQTEDLRRRGDVARRAQGGVGHREHSLARADVDLDLAVHARHEQVLWVHDPHQDREHGDVLLHSGLRLDLEHLTLEGTVGIGVDGDCRLEPRSHLADVGLVDHGAHLHGVQVAMRKSMVPLPTSRG
jgi:hypothetical protein